MIRKWLKKGGLKATDIYITEKGGVYNKKYFPEFNIDAPCSKYKEKKKED